MTHDEGHLMGTRNGYQFISATWRTNNPRPFRRRVAWGVLGGLADIADGLIALLSLGQFHSDFSLLVAFRLASADARAFKARRDADRDPRYKPDGTWRTLDDLGYPGARITCSAVPFQVEGANDGVFWYFRSRHGAWSLGISTESPDDAIGVRWAATTEENAKNVLIGTDPADLDLSHGKAADADAAAFVAEQLSNLGVRTIEEIVEEAT